MAKRKAKHGKKQSGKPAAARKARQQGKKIDLWTLLLLLVIVAYAFDYCIVYVGGPSFYGDDTTYLSLAENVLAGNFQEGSYIFSIRLLQIFPIALSYKLFGISMISSSAWDIVSFLGAIIVAFLVGRELYSNKAGLIAAFLLAFFPTVAILAPTISDDITMMFFTSLAMLALLYGERRSSKRWFFACGFLLVCQPLLSPEGEIIIVVALAYILVEIARGRIMLNRTSAHLLYGMIVAGLLLMAANYAFSGNPIVTYTTSSQFYSAVGVQGANGAYVTIPSTNTDMGFYPDYMFPYDITGLATKYLASGRLDLSSFTTVSNQSGFYFYALVAAVIYLLCLALLKKSRYAYFALFWLFGAFLYLEAGPMSVHLFPFSYLLSYRLGRFLALIAVPSVVVIGMAIANVTDVKGAKGIIAAVLCIALVALLIVNAVEINLFWYNVLYVERYDQLAAAQLFNSKPNNTVIYSSSAESNIPIYMAFDNMSRYHIYDETPSCHQIPVGSYVVVPAYEEVYGLNYTPDPLRYCPGWAIVLPSANLASIPSYIVNDAQAFRANVYYVVNSTA